MKRKCLTVLVLGILPLVYGPSPAVAQSLSSFAVLGGSTVTNTNTPTIVTGNLGVSPGSAVTGFPPGIVVGTIHAADSVAALAQTNLTTVYNSLANASCNTDLTGQDLGGKTLTPGVYCFSTSAQLTGTLTLDAQGNSNAIFIFKIGSTLTTASASSVLLINSASSCGVFWQVGSSATLSTGTALAGSIVALSSIILNTGASVTGRVLARNGAVTLDDNHVTVCSGGPGLPPFAASGIGTIDNVPAATLLLPYFEVDLDNPNGLTTLFSINNASATAVLAHVTIWSDLSVHVLDFMVYLTGYDVQTINLRDILINGTLPITASAGQDPTDTISPKGIFSQDINFASCGVPPNPILPYPAGGLNALSPAYIPHLQASLTGKASPVILSGLCAGRNLGDNIARGYITVDTVSACTTLSPGDAGYFGVNGVTTDQNVLWGDFFIVNTPMNFAQGGPLVHIEASNTDPKTITAGAYTFYGRYDGFTAVDHREALATTFVTRFLNGGTFSGGTDLLVWRDSKVNQGPFACPAIVGRPTWFPLGQEGIVIFDEQEHPSVPPGCTISPCVPNTGLIPFPAEAQRVHVNGPALPVPFNFGWLYLDLNVTVSGVPFPPLDPAAAQAWVISTYSANGQFAVGVNGIQLDNAFAAQHFVP